MNNVLKIEMIIVLLLFLLFIVNSIRRNRMNLKYSLIWIFSSIVILVFVLIPGLLEWTTKMLGFQVTSNMIYMLAIVAILLIVLSLTTIVSRQADEIRSLIQEVSLLKSEKKEKR